MNITKKWTVFCLAAALAATMTLGAMAETPDQPATSEEAVEQAQENRITGTIVEIDLENGEALIFNEEMGEVLMRF